MSSSVHFLFILILTIMIIYSIFITYIFKCVSILANLCLYLLLVRAQHDHIVGYQQAPGGGSALPCDSPDLQIEAHQYLGPHVLGF